MRACLVASVVSDSVTLWTVAHQAPLSCIYIYHIFFLHSPINWYLSCLYILATVNNAIMNIGVHAIFLN